MIRAYYRPRRALFLLFIAGAAIVAWLIRDFYKLVAPGDHSLSQLTLVWLVTFVIIAAGNILAYFERPRKTTAAVQSNVCVIIPAYNEDPKLLRNCINSMLRQTRRPDTIFVVDDGSTNDYGSLRRDFEKRSEKSDIHMRWVRTENGGKRHAQAVAVENTPFATVYVTVDSDTILDKCAIEEGLKPLSDASVSCVAGAYLPLNVSENFLTRMSSIWEVSWQMVDRSGQSALSAVMVNSGVLAFYRARTFRRYLRPYLHEEFFGRAVNFSDDSMLTLYSILDGKTVQQPTSIAFSATPSKVSHHIRRYVRWMRGSFIRSWWRFKYLPFNSWAYWLHFFRWFQVALSTAATIYILAGGVQLSGKALVYMVLVPIGISYLTGLRYFTLDRSDESSWSQMYTFLLAPVAMLWSLTVLRVVKWYAYATCLKTGWGTRQKVEVSI